MKVLNEEQKKRKENLQQSIQQAEVAVKEAEGSMDSAFEEWKKESERKFWKQNWKTYGPHLRIHLPFPNLAVN